ncbi:GNAT family N-acetyltransferase [Planosporangium sp. 12N6]|uniref:GNAT family N-acetyltransferase n=1 Tax=Planosporangium spinosum TaxID=3402278 RepID=UPI003CE8E826
MTDAPALTIDRAGADDFLTVLELLDEAAAWLQARGIQQWPARFSGDGDWRTERLRKYLADGETYLLRSDGEPIATVTWTLTADPDYAAGWPDGPDTGGYVHRMAVRRNWAGLGIGTRLLNWADTQTASAGRRWLRLDCSRTNRALQRYYERQGFTRVGEVVADIDPGGQDHPSGEIYRRGSGALYQRPVGQEPGRDSHRWSTDVVVK